MAGQHRIGKYLAEKTLGAGSFATVWLAFDELLEVHVAIKVLADNWARHADVRRRFIEEARWLRRIDHDRVIRVHDIDELEDGRPYFVMNHADRGTLHDKLKRHPAGSPMSLEEAFSLADELCEALSVVHDWDLVHRDIKPSNVLFRSIRNHERAAALRAGRYVGEDAVVVGDFGLAKDLAVASGFTLAAGTPAYMAPEQAFPTSVIDHRVDVFAVAAVIYELFAGRQAFASNTLSEVRNRRDESTLVPPLTELRSDVPAGLDDVLRQGLAEHPDDRYPSCSALAAALSAVATAAHARSTAAVLPPPTLVTSLPEPPPEAGRPAAATPPAPSTDLTGLAGRVNDLVLAARGILAEDAVDTMTKRLVRPHTISVVGLGGHVHQSIVTALRGTVSAVVRSDPPAAEAIDADVAVVVAPARSLNDPVWSGLAQRIAGAVDGPFIIVALTTSADGGAADFDRTVMDALSGPLRTVYGAAAPANGAGIDAALNLAADLAATRAVAFRAAAGASMLRDQLKRAPSSPARTALVDRVEHASQEAPLLIELELLRGITAGRVTLPPWLRTDLLRLFTHLQPARRLGLDPDSTPAQLKLAIEAQGQEWRTKENTGRVPFSARPAMLVAQQALDRLHAELSAFS